MESSFVRHDLDPAVVSKTIGLRIEAIGTVRDELKTRFLSTRGSEHAAPAKRPGRPAPVPTEAEIDQLHDKAVEIERSFYAKVRIIERIEDPLVTKRFRLVYGDLGDWVGSQGTGPFASVEEAIAWFTAIR